MPPQTHSIGSSDVASAYWNETILILQKKREALRPNVHTIHPICPK